MCNNYDVDVCTVARSDSVVNFVVVVTVNIVVGEVAVVVVANSFVGPGHERPETAEQ